MNQPVITSYLKTGFQGGEGAGKTRTSAYLALGISVVFCNKAPVLVWDSEPSWQFIRPQFEAEGVPLIHIPERSFKSLKQSLSRARKEGACVHVADQLAKPWRDLLDSFSDDTGYIGMSRQNQLRSHWDEFVDEWKDMPMHSIACGRLGWEFIDYEEDGHMKFAKGDSKMKAGGGESFGYEPFLTCEFKRKQDLIRKLLTFKKQMSHVCTVLKDQTSVLNGEQFVFEDFKGYKPGDFRTTFNAFLPHLEYLAACSGVSMSRESSKDLVHTESHWQRTDSERRALLEEWDALMDKVAAGTSGAAKALRGLIGEEITGELSRTRFEQSSIDNIARCRAVLLRFTERYREETPANEADLRTMLNLAKEEMKHIAPIGQFDRKRGVEQFHGKRPPEKTVLEANLEVSIKQAKANGGGKTQ